MKLRCPVDHLGAKESLDDIQAVDPTIVFVFHLATMVHLLSITIINILMVICSQIEITLYYLNYTCLHSQRYLGNRNRRGDMQDSLQRSFMLLPQYNGT